VQTAGRIAGRRTATEGSAFFSPSPSQAQTIFLECRSFEDYCLACLDLAAPYLPVLAEPTHKGVGIPFVADEGRREHFRAWWATVDWPERCSRIAAAAERGRAPGHGAARRPRRATLVVTGGAAAVCCALLAGLSRLRLRVVTRDLAVAVDAELAGGHGPVLAAALAEEAGDPLLLGLLARLESALGSDLPWPELPCCTLLTARDLTSFSWQVAKLAAAARRPGRPPARLLLCSAGEPIAEMAEIAEIAELAPPSPAARRRANGPELLATLLSPSAALAVQTHGTDACAKGGGGAVLCGLRAAGAAGWSGSGEAGTLACGLGHPCPRGPFPLALNRLGAEVLMLATCNSLRLRDSALTGDFNLALSFLDGPGLAYVGSVMGASGNDLAASIFLSALASGCTLAEATTLANGFLACAGIERPVYLAVGLPDHRLAGRQRSRPRRICRAAGRRDPLEQDCRSGNLTELEIDDPLWLDLARRRALALSVRSSVPGGSVHWFYRLERSAARERPARRSGKDDGAGEVLRVFAFRFPEPLGVLQMAPVDAADLTRALLESRDALARWSEVCRLSGLAAREPETRSELDGAAALLAEGMPHGLLRLRFDGSASRELQERRGLMRSLAATARDLVLQGLVPELTGVFWLPNTFSREYGWVGSAETLCPECGQTAVRKILRHPLHGESRQVDVCPRCGIVRDLRQGGSIREVSVAAPLRVGPGVPFDLRVAVRTAGSRDRLEVKVASRLSTHGLREVVPEPEIAAAQPTGGDTATFHFRFRVPTDLPPHQFFLKLLIASEEDLAFAARMIFCDEKERA
jgi:hypothetical protein